MKRSVPAFLFACVLATAPGHAQAPSPAAGEYKPGTFEKDGRTFLGVVVNAHNVGEMLRFASHILTRHPGDVLATGSPAGVGAARGVFFKDGDLSVCTIGNIGTLTDPVQGSAASFSAAAR